MNPSNSVEVGFNLTLFAMSNSTYSLFVRQMSFSVDLSEYMLIPLQSNAGFYTLTLQSRILSLPVPSRMFSGPLKTMSVTDETSNTSNYSATMADILT